MRIPILIRLFIFYLLLLPFTNQSYAGAWAQRKGHYYSKLTFIYLNSTQRFAFDQSLRRAPFSDLAAYFYIEYGIQNRGTVILSSPVFKRSRYEDTTFRGTTTGIFSGDLQLQYKYQLLDGPVVISALAGLKLPVIYDQGDLPPLGTGVIDYDAKLLMGASFYPIPVYITGDIGFRKRGEEFDNELHFNFEVGYTVRKKYLLRVFGNGIRSNNSDEIMMEPLQFAHQQDQTRLGGGLIYLINSNLEADLSYLTTTSGRSIPKSQEIYFGIAVKY